MQSNFSARSPWSRPLPDRIPGHFGRSSCVMSGQARGSSQSDLNELFEPILLRRVGVRLQACNSATGPFIYLDEATFTGLHLIADITNWLPLAPARANVHIINFASFSGGLFYAEKKVREAAMAAGKTMNLKFWSALVLKNKSNEGLSADVLRLSSYPSDNDSAAYLASFDVQQPPRLLRPTGSPSMSRLFTGEAGKDLLERVFWKAGLKVRSQCPNLPIMHRPLGYTSTNSDNRLGFGSLLVTYRNCPNNAPLALWAGAPWYTAYTAENQLMTDLERIYQRDECITFRKTTEPFGGLSNMAPGYQVRVNGILLRTVEALYQSCRFPHIPSLQDLIVSEKSPMTLKMRTKRYRSESRPDWDKVRVRIMKWCLRVKLAQNYNRFSELLLRTGDKPIVEDSRKDPFWGAIRTTSGDLVGANVLGRLLMELREELRAGLKAADVPTSPPHIPNLILLGIPLDSPQAQNENKQIDLWESTQQVKFRVKCNHLTEDISSAIDKLLHSLAKEGPHLEIRIERCIDKRMQFRTTQIHSRTLGRHPSTKHRNG